MRALAVHPSDRLFYALNEDSYNVSVYAMNPTTGLLTLLKNVQTGADPADIKVHLNARFAYVTERQGGGSPSTTSYTLWRYAIDLMGEMTHVATLRTGGASPVSVALHPTSQFIYVANLHANGGALRGRLIDYQR
jgi:6-phosphogluconolactonase (cycloisomerase 2 family)